jgi:ATP adenylyltransferase/5',5'''-P-1,P-4-tetraphosphate phosphorylase II
MATMDEVKKALGNLGDGKFYRVLPNNETCVIVPTNAAITNVVTESLTGFCYMIFVDNDNKYGRFESASGPLVRPYIEVFWKEG